MPLVDITLQPGVLRNGTPYNSRGRWYEANLVRWHDGSLRPIGGWQRRTAALGAEISALIPDPDAETVRDAMSHRDNNGTARMTFGSNLAVYDIDDAGAVTNITPAAFVGGMNDVSFNVGYGTGLYGLGPYGVARDSSGADPVSVSRWSFDTWGENVLASFTGGTLYESTQGSQLVAVANAPSAITDFIVTDERIVMAIVAPSAGQRRIEWSDREDNTVWTPTISNYAGGKTIAGTGDLIGVYKILGQYLILGENDAHRASYLGAPFVYGFRTVGEQCGPIDKNAVVVTDRIAMWLGQRNFWVYDGTLRSMPCDIMDHINDTMDRSKVSKMFSMTVSDYSELWWFYQSKTGDEVDSYITYDYLEGHWSYGSLARTAGFDKGATRSPVMISFDGTIWNHEQEFIPPAGDAYAMTGPLTLKNGNTNVAVRYMFPDTEAKDAVEFEFLSRQHSTDPLYSHGTFPYDDPVSTTGVLGKEVFLKVTGLTATWEFGVPRLDVDDLDAGYR